MKSFWNQQCAVTEIESTEISKLSRKGLKTAKSSFGQKNLVSFFYLVPFFGLNMITGQKLMVPFLIYLDRRTH